MIGPVTGFVLLEAVLLGVWALVSAVRRRPLQPGHVVGLVLLEAALVLHGIGAGMAMLAGHRSAEAGTHTAFLLASVVVLPVLLGMPELRRSRVGVPRPGDPWRAGLVALGCAAVVAVVSGMWATWEPVAV